METVQDIQKRITSHLKAETALSTDRAPDGDFWRAVSRTVLEMLADRWTKTIGRYRSGRQTHYFSAEFLQGRSLLNHLINLGLYETFQEAVAGFGRNLTDLLEEEPDPALGNGGLGRLAACFLDSSATLELPVTGYGILYRYGLFRQAIENGFQKEYPDVWMEKPYPFLIRHDQDRVLVHYSDMDVYAVPFDMPITGFGTDNVNTLRLWKPEPAQEFDFNLFNAQRFDDAVIQRNRVNDIFRVLYPNDSSYDGKVLRVRQQYFFISASLQSILQDYIEHHGSDLTRFAEYNAIQLNDTHPVLAIPELMRLLTVVHDVDWDTAWDICRKTFAYTNHTILSEALEKWDIGIFQFLFPEILRIIERINAQFRQELQGRGLTQDRIDYLAPLGDSKVRMAWLAIYGSHSVNGVAAIHTGILKNETLRDFHELWPEKFSNKTNGVTPRRWLRACNPRLSNLISELDGGEAWVKDLNRLGKLAKWQNDATVLSRLREIKQANKRALADHLWKVEQVQVDPASIFDVQVKRLHEYKRQFLNALAILDLYYRLKEDSSLSITPHTFLFGAKAAPGYFRAKAIIKFINEVARLIERDPYVSQLIKVVFLTNYNVSYGEKVFPAADVSEQISTVGMEASGTGNMKFMMNGALTLGTMDGANIEIAEAAGIDNCYIFGPRLEHFPQTKAYYNPQWQYQNIAGLKRTVDALINGTLSDAGSGMFQDLYNSLLNGSSWHPADPYYVLGDFDEYRRTRNRLQADYRDSAAWSRKCWINITASGRFSSDRTIREYAQEIWQIEPQPTTR